MVKILKVGLSINANTASLSKDFVLTFSRTDFLQRKMYAIKTNIQTLHEENENKKIEETSRLPSKE